MISNGLLEVQLDPLVSFISAEPAPDSISGDFLYWSFEGLYPTYSGKVLLFLQMPGVEFLGKYISLSTVMTLSGQDGGLNTLVATGFRSQINCSVDPNDKLVDPNIPGYDNYTLFGDTLDYTIRFQNTGTDTAFTIRIEDFLDAHLNWSSLRIVGGSHDFSARLDLQSGRLVFTFKDILLPDSTTNEQASHGYVRYRIRHLEGLPENTWVANTASIFFDYNPPILTNTVYNILVSQYPLLLEFTPPFAMAKLMGASRCYSLFL
ncbi:MAG: DUF11 domain-containing protein [Saprospirales bacterium]|nr:DUF11 domain-containing protein [Saprospirales bacterium]